MDVHAAGPVSFSSPVLVGWITDGNSDLKGNTQSPLFHGCAPSLGPRHPCKCTGKPGQESLDGGGMSLHSEGVQTTSRCVDGLRSVTAGSYLRMAHEKRWVQERQPRRKRRGMVNDHIRISHGRKRPEPRERCYRLALFKFMYGGDGYVWLRDCTAKGSRETVVVGS